MSTGSRFIGAAVAALFVSVVSAGFLAARRAQSRPAAASLSVSAEPTPTAVPSPAVSPEPIASAQPVAAPDVEPTDRLPSAPARSAETVLSKAAAPKPAVRTATKARTPVAPVVAPVPAREVAPVRPVTSTVPAQPAPAPALEPVVEAPTARPAPPAAGRPTVEAVASPPRAPAVETAPVEIPRPPVEIPRVQFEEHTVKADSVLGIRIDQSLSSATAKLEDRVTASLSRNLIVDGRTVLPTGTRLEGEVTLVQPGSKFKGRARLGIRFHTLVLADGLRVPIQSETIFRDGESATGSTATKVGGGAAAGAILGGMLGGKRGAIIGAGVGAAGGTAAVMAGDTKDAVLERGTPLTMRVTSPVTLTIERDQSSR